MNRIVLTLALVTIISGCESFKEGYNQAFVSSWKESFIKSCSGNQADPDQIQVCTCTAERAVEELTVKQLHDVSYATKYIEENILPDCLEGY